MRLTSGDRVGGYEIVSNLGVGGMGEVYRAIDTRLSRHVAIKILSDEYRKDAAALERFEREARATASLSHPNILEIHEFERGGEHPFFVTELLEGQTLRYRLDAGALPWRKAVEIAAAVADGLAAAHSRGLIHRDIKPENIFVTTDGRVKILDFGIAQLRQSALQRNETSSALTEPLRADGSVIGTIGYIAPEQLQGSQASAASDIFALGCVLHEMVVGRQPFARGTTFETMAAVMREEPPTVLEAGKRVPAEIQRIISRCLEKNPNERFQSASDLAFALRALGNSTSLQYELPALTPRSHLPLLLILLGIVAGVAAVIVLYPRAEGSAGRSRTVDSLAVLPFANQTRDADAEYFSDGITESLINSLSQLPDMRVMSRTSVFHYKGSEINSQEIGRKLDVDAVLIGRISQIGETLVISTELVDTRDGTQLWGAQFQRTTGDIFAIQDGISSEISKALRLRLTGPEQSRLTKRFTDDPEAYHLYLKGRYFWNKRSAEGLKKAIEHFDQAIAIDPNYALAYAGLADCYNLLDIWAGLPTKDTFPKAKAAALRALQLDDELAEAHTSLAYALHNYEWNWAEAENEYQRALELNPNYATAHQWYSELLAATGRFDDSSIEARLALELDPLSPIINAVLGWNYSMARRYADAIEQNRRTIELFPDFMPGYAYLGLAQLESGAAAEAIESLKKAQSIEGNVVVYTWLVRAHRRHGDQEEAARGRATLQRRQSREYLPPYYLAALDAELGDQDGALESLQRALAERTGALVWLKVDPAMDPLRRDPRYADLVARVGL